MFLSKWTPERGSGHLFRPDLLGIPTSSVIFGVAVYGEQKTSPHGHADSDEWFMVVDGVGNIETDGEPHVLSAGGIVYTPPYAWHAFQGRGGPFRILFGIYGWRTYIQPKESETVAPVEGRNSIVRTLRDARAEASGGKLSLTLLEPENVGRLNCLGVKYCIYAPGAAVQAHAHEGLEQVAYIASGTVQVRVGEERRSLSRDEAVYIPASTVHSLENWGRDPVAVVNAYYASRHLWNGSIEAFLTKLDPSVERARLRYPSEI
ncbi:MAG: cupin domain-containing protein [Candidatus Bathyarchaeia archaeon]